MTTEETAALLRTKQQQMRELREEITTLERALMPVENAVKDYLWHRCGLRVVKVVLFSSKEVYPLVYMDRSYMQSIEKIFSQTKIHLHGLALSGGYLEAMITMPEDVMKFRPESEIIPA